LASGRLKRAAGPGKEKQIQNANPKGCKAKRRPEAAFGGSCKPSYFIAPDAALMAPEAALIAEDAASIAEVAAEEAAPIALEAASIAAAGAAIVGAGVVVVVVVVASSFLLQAANETAAARVTISNAVFIFLLDFKVRTITGHCGNPLVQESQRLQDMERSSISSA
jgi:hypothetical protein